MVVSNYFYESATVTHADYMGIDGLTRDKRMNPQFIKRQKSKLKSIDCSGSIGVLYCLGTAMHQSETSNVRGIDYTKFTNTVLPDSSMAIQASGAYMMNKYIGQLADPSKVQYASMNANTCASSMYALYEAERLLERVDTVVVIADERTSADTIRIFHEQQIPLTPSDGFACMVLTNDGTGPTITNTKWEYVYNRNPFYSDSIGYDRVAQDADSIKPHDTGTEQNTEAEARLLEGKKVHSYKSKIGHSQGTSTLLETCILLDDESASGKILCTASGLGGFYGSCIVHK